MPDYNPAVATGINTEGPDLGKVLGTINQLQIGQAHLGLYNLQALQQQRQYNALMAGSSAYRNSGGNTDAAVQAVLDNGGDPNTAAGFQNLGATRNALAIGGGVTPAVRNEAAQYPGVLSENLQKQTKADADVAKQYGPGVLLNPDDDGAWRQLVLGHAKAVGMNQVETQAALNIKDPNQRVDGAIRYGAAAGVPLDKLTEVFGRGGAPAGDQDINDYNNKNLTPAQRVGAAPILRQPGEVAQAKSQAEKQGAYFSNLYSGIAATGNTAANARDEINVAKSVINDPGFYSGTGEHINLAYKRALASLGVDPGASLPQEAFRKVMSQNILQQVNGLRAAQEEMGAAGGRIFQSQIELMEKAAQNPDNSIAANRFLTELADRASQRNMKLSDMAGNYKGGKLDAGFEKQMRDYVSKNPLFSEAELAHPKLIGLDPRETANLKKHPETAAQFDAYYGNGASGAVLGR